MQAIYVINEDIDRKKQQSTTLIERVSFKVSNDVFIIDWYNLKGLIGLLVTKYYYCAILVSLIFQLHNFDHYNCVILVPQIPVA